MDYTTFQADGVHLMRGDCLAVLKTLPDNSVDAVVTDPPYGLSDHRPAEVQACLAAWLAGEPYTPKGRGFMGKAWDAWVPGPEVWREVLRVLKPGGHILVFAGTRSMDLMSMALRLAGFELRDAIGYAHGGGGAPLLAWAYGSGFPKSLDVSKAIDKAKGEIDGKGWGTALKPAWEPIILARKPLDGTVAKNVLEHGTGALNIDGCRVPTDEKLGGGAQSSDWRRKDSNEGWKSPWMEDAAAVAAHSARIRENVQKAEALGRWPANLIHDGSDEVLAAFPSASGAKGGTSGSEASSKTATTFGGFAGRAPSEPRGDAGSAARFFYCAKASRADRNDGVGGSDEPAVHEHATMGDRERADWPARNGNFHPTVKPTELMRYLVRLVTPPGGTVLDCYTGSGSTGKAAVLEGFGFVGIERDEDENGQPLGYMDIAVARIRWAMEQAANDVTARKQSDAQGDLFQEAA